MSIRDKFVYVKTKSQDQTCIGLTEKSGKYHGVVYKYGKVGFGEENLDGTKPLRFEYNIVDNNGIPREQFGDEFFKLIGDILVEVMEEQIKDEPVNRKDSSK